MIIVIVIFQGGLVKFFSWWSVRHFVSLFEQVLFEGPSVKHGLYLILMIILIFVLLVTRGVLITAWSVLNISSGKALRSWLICPIRRLRSVFMVIIVWVSIVLRWIVTLIALVIFKLLSPLLLEVFKRAIAELCPFNVIDVLQRPLKSDLVCGIILIVATARWIFLVWARPSREHATFKGHGLQNQSHLNYGSEVSLCCFVTGIESQMSLVLALKVLLHEVLELLKISIVEGCLKEVEDLNGKLTRNVWEFVVLNHLKHCSDEVSSENGRKMLSRVEVHIFGEGLDLLLQEFQGPCSLETESLEWYASLVHSDERGCLAQLRIACSEH